MRFVALFEDPPGMAAVRERLGGAHLAFLEQHRDEIRMAGGLRHEAGGAFAGGLWVFEVSDRQRAVALIEADPFQQALPRPYRLWLWGKALPQFDVAM